MNAAAVTARWFDVEAIGAAERGRWAGLFDEAGVNPFAAPWFVCPVLRLGHARLLVAVDARGRWQGVLPIASARVLGRVPLPHWTSVRHAHQFDGAPLIAEHDATSVWRCLLDALARRRPWMSALHLGLCARNASTIEALIAEREPALVVGRHERPLLRLDQLDNAAPPPRRLRLDRQWQRFTKEHDVSVRVLRPGDALDQWLDALMTLEARSWKGRAGSAVGSEASNATLFKDVLRGAHRAGSLRMVAISVGGRPVALNSFFVTRGEAHGFKASFDAEFGKFAPGLQAVRLASEVAAEQGVATFDSCASGLDTPIAELWPGRRSVADLVVPLGKRRRVLLTGALAATRYWHLAKRKFA